MPWTEELPSRLRYFINDISSPYQWTDDQLRNFIGLAVIHTSVDLSKYGGSTIYELTMASGVTLTPDPIDTESDPVLNLMVIKAAHIASNAELKKLSASAGIKITDDRSTIDTSNQIGQIRLLVNTYLDMYNDLLNSFKFNNSFDGASVLSPYADSDGSLYSVPLYGRTDRYC